MNLVIRFSDENIQLFIRTYPAINNITSFNFSSLICSRKIKLNDIATQHVYDTIIKTPSLGKVGLMIHRVHNT